jgi:hypothetical protein
MSRKQKLYFGFEFKINIMKIKKYQLIVTNSLPYKLLTIESGGTRPIFKNFSDIYHPTV